MPGSELGAGQVASESAPGFALAVELAGAGPEVSESEQALAEARGIVSGGFDPFASLELETDAEFESVEDGHAIGPVDCSQSQETAQGNTALDIDETESAQAAKLVTE